MRHCSKIESSSTTLAIFLAASLPAAMAILQSASFKAKYIIYAITGHGNCMLLCLQCLYHLFLLLWCYSAEYTVLCHCPLHFFRCRNGCCINIMIRILQSCLSSQWQKLSQDHLRKSLSDQHPDCQKRQRIRCFLPDHICDQKQSHRFQPCRKFCAFCFLITVCQDQNTKTFFCISAAMRKKFFISFRKRNCAAPIR